MRLGSVLYGDNSNRFEFLTNPHTSGIMLPLKRSLQLLSAVSLLAGGHSLQAAPQKFSFSYEAKTLAQGQFEFENNMNWGHSSGEDGYKFEHEFEYGITDNFQISVLAVWEHEKVAGEGSDSAFGYAGVEGIYQLSNPTKDVVGSALLGEVAIGPDELNLESKFILSKDVGPLSFVYNVGLEAVWENDYNDPVAEFEQSFGVSYAVCPNFSVGIEGLHAAVFPDWSSAEENGFYLGPNIGIRSGSFWGVVTAGWEVTNDEASPDVMLKVRFGFVF